MTQSAEERAPGTVAKAAGNAHISYVTADAFMDGVGESVEGGRLAVTRLVLTDFRCYRQARLAVDVRPVVLTGPNGAGKTNLLEAISFLAPGRGLRRARLGEIDRREAAEDEATPWAVAAEIETPRGVVPIGTGREATASGGERRAVRI